MPVFIKVDKGEFLFGSNEGNENESPEVPIKMKSFYLSQAEISIGQFNEFVKETGYKTSAEVNGESAVFIDSAWQMVPKANWFQPEGRPVELESIKDKPVTHVSVADAKAYCKWIGARLPSEIELEYVLKQSKQAKMNIWSGNFPSNNDGEDGFENTAPVTAPEFYDGSFYHLKGNVWEWTEDVYHFEIHDKLAFKKKRKQIAYTGAGYNLEDIQNADSYQVIKGGSYLCNKCYCSGYRPEARQKAKREETFSHIGFRVAKDKK